jgi:glutamine phosphoribosylpyrophosphate amidotransferase
MKTECGLIGTFINNPISKEDLYYSLAEIQHRGQDSYGFVSIHTSNSNAIGLETRITKEKGLLPEIEDLDLNGDGAIAEMKSSILFLGHMRYSTNTTVENLDASLTECNIQPVEISKEYGIYIAHNGNLPNLKNNMRRLGLSQYYKNGMSDTYLFKVIWNVKFAGRFGANGAVCKLKDILEYLKYIIMNVAGAYSCVMTFCETTENSSGGEVYHSSARTSVSSISSNISEIGSSSDESIEAASAVGAGAGIGIGNSKYNFYLLGFRDRYGYKPLSYGSLESNYCFFSESVQLQDSKYFIGDVGAGEIWYSENNKKPLLLGRIRENVFNNPRTFGFVCSLEPIYFMKRHTLLFYGNTTVDNFRRRLGIELAKSDIYNLSHSLNPDNPYDNYYEATQTLKKRVILYVPESAYSIALGYNDMLGKWLRTDLITKVQNIRSFIENTHEAREGKLKRKFAFNDEGLAALGDAEIVLIDDTIVRGNTMRYVISELYKRNPALKIHVRIGSPRLVKECSFGIDLYDDELIATKEHDLARWLNVASVEFLNIDTLAGVFEKYNMMNCKYCFGVSNKFNQKTLEW